MGGACTLKQIDRGTFVGRIISMAMHNIQTSYKGEIKLVKAISDVIKQMFSTLSTKSVQKDIEKKIGSFIQRDQKRLANVLNEIENIKKEKTIALCMKFKKNTDY